MIDGAVASTSRDDGAHCRARPACTFTYARPSRFTRGHNKQTSLEVVGRSAHVLSHNPMMAVTPGIPPAGNLGSRVQHTRRSRGHKSFIRGEATLMSPARRQSRPLVCAHIPCVAPTSLLDRVWLPLRLRKKCCVLPIGAMFYTPGIKPALSGTTPPCTSSILRDRCG